MSFYLDQEIAKRLSKSSIPELTLTQGTSHPQALPLKGSERMTFN